MVQIEIDTNKIDADKKDGQKLDVFDSKYLKANQTEIKKGTEFVNVDLAKLKQLGYDNSTLVLVINETLGNNKVELIAKENQIVKTGDDLFKVIP